GSDQYDLHVHDNIIRNTVCDGLNFATVNPGKGPVEAYNNLIYHAGTGPAPGDESVYTCLYANGTAGGTADFYNNTLYDCGGRGGGDAGGFAVDIPVRLRNNIVDQLSSETYLTPNTAGNCA